MAYTGARQPLGPTMSRALVVGFYELSKRELRAPDEVRPPTPNPISRVIDEEIAGGRMRYDAQLHTLAVTDETARDAINTRLLPILNALERAAQDPSIVAHLRSAGSDFARVVANSPAVFDAPTGTLVFLSHEDALATNARLTRARAASTIIDPNLRYCQGELGALGACFTRDEHGALGCVLPRHELVGEALATLYEASRPAPQRLNRLQSLLYSPEISDKVGLGPNPSADQLERFAQRLTRWDIERLERQLGPALYATYRDGLTIDNSQGRNATNGRSVDQYFAQPAERARSERPFEIGPNPEDATDRARRLARERERGDGRASLYALRDDRATLEQLIERQQNAPGETVLAEQPLTRERGDNGKPGLIIVGTLVKLTRFHGLIHARDGGYHVFEIDGLAQSKIGERAAWKEGPPVRPALLAIANAGASVWLRRDERGELSFEAERPQTIKAQRERALAERTDTSLEFGANQRLKLDLALCMRQASELFARAHNILPDKITSMSLADRAEELPYRGTIGWVGSCYFAQICKAGSQYIAVAHELAAFDRTPEVGANWTVTYPQGEEFARGQCSVARTRDTQLRELARELVPALEGEQAVRHEQRLYALAAMTASAQLGITHDNLPLIDVGALTQNRYFEGTVVQAGPELSFAHVEGAGLIALDHGRLARSFDVGDRVGVHCEGKHRQDISLAPMPQQITVGKHERVELALERERDEKLARYERDKERLIDQALRRISARMLAEYCGLTQQNCIVTSFKPGEPIDRSDPHVVAQDCVNVSVALATSSHTYFVGERLEGGYVAWEVPTYDERGFERSGMSQARQAGGATLSVGDDGEITISPRIPDDVDGRHIELNVFRPIEASRDEHGAYTGDKFAGSIAAIGDAGIVVDTGHYDYVFIDRDELDQRDLANLEAGEDVVMEFRAGLVKVDRTRELTQIHERADREIGGMSL